VIVRGLGVPAWIWADWVNGQSIEGLIEAYASYDTVGLEIDPERFDWESIAAAGDVELLSVEPRTHDVPVCYALGEDMDQVAGALELSTQAVAQIHAEGVYRCEAVGFCPGFPYLSGLDPRLHGIPRRASPRTHIEPGSVAFTGAQCGIYPLVRPGGWAIVGRTPLTIVDVEERYFPIRAGDQVRFRPIDRPEYDDLKGGRL
jgi:inhibitor of KinA